MKKSISKQIAVVFGVAVPVLFGIGALQYQSILGLINAYNQVVRSNETLEGLEAMRSMLGEELAWFSPFCPVRSLDRCQRA